jgi:hypothetical protein
VSPSFLVSPSPATEIHSASTELLTSENLEQLRHLLTDAYNERDELTREVSSATNEANTATRRYQKWERGFLMKRLFKQSFATRKETAETAAAKLEELQEQLRLTTIATEIAVDREQAEPYYRMRDDFAALSECQNIWNVLSEKAIDRIAERSTANTAIARNPVSFLLGSCDLIQWEQTVPHLPNHTKGDTYLYPGFILYRASKQAFALIDFRKVSLGFVSTQFTEADAVPSDTQVIGHTWAKSNKDGTPDRRFADNFQLPVVHYGSLLFSSQDGLDVRYLCSNAALAERFAKSWAAFRTSLGSEPGAEAQSANPFERFKAAHAKFKAAHATFGKNLPGGHMRHSELAAYMSAVSEFIEATNEFEKNSNSSRTARARFRRAVLGVEAARAHLEECISLGQTPITESLNAYVNALAVFFGVIPRS